MPSASCHPKSSTGSKSSAGPAAALAALNPKWLKANTVRGTTFKTGSEFPDCMNRIEGSSSAPRRNTNNIQKHITCCVGGFQNLQLVIPSSMPLVSPDSKPTPHLTDRRRTHQTAIDRWTGSHLCEGLLPKGSGVGLAQRLRCRRADPQRHAPPRAPAGPRVEREFVYFGGGRSLRGARQVLVDETHHETLDGHRNECTELSFRYMLE